MLEVHPEGRCPISDTPVSGTTFCSLADAADWISRHSGEGSAQACLHPGVHRLREPISLNNSHSGSRWATCASAAGGRAVISGGLNIPPSSWQREAGGLWAASLPAGAAVKHLRTLWVGSVRANRTVLNASALLGDLRPTPTGYLTQHAVPWQSDAEEVELNYFVQLAPWQAQRCVLTHAAGHSLTVAQPCFASISERAAGVPGLPRNRSSGRTGCADSDPGCGLLGNPLGSGLPMFVENIPLDAPGLSQGSAAPGHFSFSPRQQKLLYSPHSHELSKDGKAFTADVVVPVSEGLIGGVGLRDASFVGIDFEHMAWNSPSHPAGFIDLQDGETELGYILGGLDCSNCSDVSVVRARLFPK